MKLKTLTFFLILFSLFGFSQISDNAISIEDAEFNDYYKSTENIPIVKGRILNLSKEELEAFTINYTLVTPFEQGQIGKSCGLNPDGTFELILDNAFPYQQIWFSPGDLFYAGIYAHTDLFIELDAKELSSKGKVRYNGEGVKYLGSDGELNKYMNNHVLFKRLKQLALHKAASTLLRDRDIESDTFIAKLDSLFALYEGLDNEFIKQNPSEFSWLLKNERQSDYYGRICVRHWGKELSADMFKKVKKHKSYLTSNDGMGFYNYLFTYLKYASYKGHKKDYKAYKSYSFLSPLEHTVLDSIALIEENIEKLKVYDTTKYIALTKHANAFLKDTLVIEKTLLTTTYLDREFEKPKADFLKMKITSKDPKAKSLQMKTVLKQTKTNWCRAAITKMYHNSLEKLKTINNTLNKAEPVKGDYQLGIPIAEMPFGAKMFKVDNLSSTQLLANLKSTFECKALIIDFWATWCGPCLREMPHSKQLYDDRGDLPVEFVYLCTSRSSSLDLWKAKVAEFKLGGTHIYVEQNIENELMSLFSLSGFPSYVLIDKNGEYVPGAIQRITTLDKKKLEDLAR